jgi:hypothetical protein
MSIILRALKKVQNQELDKKTADEKSSGESSPEVPLESSEGVSPEDASLQLQASAETPSASARAAEHIRSSRIPWILLGLITVLGLLATAWFATEIYVNMKSDSPEADLQARTGAKDNGQPVKQEALIEPPAQRPGEPATPAPNPEAAPAPTVAQPNAAASEQSAKPATRPAEISPAPPPARQTQPPHIALPKPAQKPVLPPLAPAEPESSVTETAPEPEPAAVSEPALTPIQPQPKEAEPAPKESQPQPQGKPELKINAIAWREQEPKAIVNMQRVYVGDVIEGATVKEIRRKSVIFEYDGEEFEVRF